ncbi:MAG TPA: outer membrane beta-barrel protein [bacterium]|nr:outer membrane beta-barrel protein [bacterium]HPJ71772.1 outer membrane beta-barrel protein [bacterium]HPQ65296.1 outer membrane beta-barrel protein [bacterium]
MRTIIAGIFALAAVCLVAGTAGAQTPKVGLEAHGLYAFNFNDDDFGSGNEPDNVFGGGGSLVFCLGNFVKLDLGADYFKPESKFSSDMKFQFIPVAGTLRLGGTVAEVLYLYVGGGGGWSFNEYDGPDDDVFELEDSFTYHGCGGAELFLSPQIAIRGEFRYVWMRPDLKFKPSGDKEEIKFDHMQVRAGVAFYF